MRGLMIAVAWASVALAVVGAFLPLLPTTPFLLLSAGIFARTSPRFEAWLLSHPTFGRPIKSWRERRAIPVRAKAAAVVTMILSFLVLVWFAPGPLPLTIVGAIMTVCAAFIVSRPSA
ncbi:hypothetical protein CO662_34410 [Rhizobium anhuiense]|uniref:DUF454 domain-containing protein n=1 Tax=Rhizobium anhuiense TaxID=1184720 RepID=A0ABX4IY69_9HYPH|nr:YbaN family protein [Rhizobium anhuiense]PDS40588.1 hypothetical protein CO668_33355 [Rhizobium anhuiense]PDS47512.1 hypothetical protein CO662_34410 [Rhizobium anhuiense]